MRIKIEAIPLNTVSRIPIQYNSSLQGYIYQMFETTLPELHTNGYALGNKKFKHFCFSRITSKGMKFENRMIKIFNPIYFTMSFFLDPMPNIVIKHLIRERILRIGNEEFVIKNAQVSSEYFTGDEKEVEFDFQTLSPICVYKTFENEPYPVYYSPFDPEFYELLKNNLKAKYESIFSEAPEEDLDCFVVPVNVDPKRTLAKVYYKRTPIKAYSGKFHYKGSGKLAQIAFNTGFGSKNPQGFGLVNYSNCKVLNEI